jgi:flagellin-specific chaperone FliS
MVIALHHRERDLDHGALPARVSGLAPVLSLLVVDEALEFLALAGTCIEDGSDPRPHLLSAMVRVRELPSLLPVPAGDALAVNFAELIGYICRQLSHIAEPASLSTLADMCDLLREIRCAWVTPPAATAILSGAARALS